ncbi:TonB-dependent receptor [Polaribacter gangjinensis]|uniref:TonB-dependent receptor n=1 Tax=Polaribacter gangjinensis TaxID=574710 RepID=UPI000CF47672|nr:TonB-dependent receptor [Polaribacter gangjinensis]
MKKGFLILAFISVFNVFSQKKTTEKVKDTVKTEVVEVVTTYNPKIADANKISTNPSINLLEKTKKQPLKYTIFSVPVASTFIPKSGVIKGIDVGVKERIYDNFLAAGFGNYTSPYFETFLHKNTRFQSEFGLSAKYNASFDNIENTVLNSDFSNLGMSIFYKQDERYFDWKVTINSERNHYNWYGIDQNFINNATTRFINERQEYNFFNATGEMDFLDAYVDKSNLSISYFNDDFNSEEILIGLNTDLDIPTRFLRENVKIGTKLEYLNGSFASNYAITDVLNYNIFTIKIAPEYNTTYKDFTIKLGAKIFTSFDAENSVTNFLVYPDVKVQKALLKENLQFFGGISGNLKTNTYKDFVDDNPFVSPTMFITQTAERFNAFVGFNGVLNNSISYTISASFKNEQDKPLFIKNNSKSDGTTTSSNGIVLRGYEYGNSFGVVYDDVKTTSIFAELNYEFSKRLNFETHIQFDNYTTTNQNEAWNLPAIQANFMAKYKNEKWYATSTLLFVGNRKDVLYTNVFPSTTSTTQSIPSFLDLNLNGGYHLNDKFTVFLKMNNMLNSNYQRFSNFEVQGFQLLAGVTYKFDF